MFKVSFDNETEKECTKNYDIDIKTAKEYKCDKLKKRINKLENDLHKCQLKLIKIQNN
jgi:hypothetical protein